MLIFENINLAITSLKSNKMRALLTMLGIIIGIAAVISIFTVGNSLTISISENMQSLGANDVYAILSPKTEDEKVDMDEVDGIRYGSFQSGGELSKDDMITPDMISDLCDRFSEEIHAISIGEQLGTGTVSMKKETVTSQVYGVSAGFFVINKMNIIAGNMFSQRNFENKAKVCLVSDKFVDSLFNGDYQGAIGKEIELDVANTNENFIIVGVYKAEGMGGNSAMMSTMVGMMSQVIYIPLKTSYDILHEDEAFMYFEIIPKVGVDSNTLANKVKDYYKAQYKSNPDYYINTFSMESMVSMFTTMLGTVTTAISIVAGIALVVGGIGVMNIMLVSVTERTREIGTRKALGAKNSSIRAQFIVEAIIICLIGGIIGVILGIVAGSALSSALGYPAKPNIMGIIIALAFSMSIGLFFGYYPANKAAKMNPIDALRYE